MSNRGDVLRMRRRLGFGARAEGEAVAVMQADALNRVLPTVLVVPLDPATALHRGNPLAVPVPAAEAGSSVDHVALVHQLRAVAIEALAPGVGSRLGPATLAAVDRALRFVLDLP